MFNHKNNKKLLLLNLNLNFMLITIRFMLILKVNFLKLGKYAKRLIISNILTFLFQNIFVITNIFS